MGKTYRKICCLILIFILLLGVSQVRATTLEDEGTEGNASEYTSWQGASCDDEPSESGTQVSAKDGSSYLKYKCPTSDIHGQAYRELSYSFDWGDFDSVSLWTYRPDGEFNDDGDAIRLVFRIYSSVLEDGMKVTIEVSEDPADKWVQHTFQKNDFTDYYGGLTSSDEVNYMGWHNLIYTSDTGDHIFLDGLEIKAGSLTLDDEGTEDDANDYSTWQGAAVSDISGISIYPRVGSYVLKYQCPTSNVHGQLYRTLSSSFQWSAFQSLTIWTYRPSNNFDNEGDCIRIVFRTNAGVLEDGMKATILVSSNTPDTWVQHTIQKSDFTDYYDGFTGFQNEVNYMAWHNLIYTSDPGDIIFLDGLNIEISGGMCLGTLTVSAFTVIALILIGTRLRTPKKL